MKLPQAVVRDSSHRVLIRSVISSTGNSRSPTSSAFSPDQLADHHSPDVSGRLGHDLKINTRTEALAQPDRDSTCT